MGKFCTRNQRHDIDWTQPAANYKIGTYTAFANKDEAMTAVQWEIRLEFATEGMRFFDLRRWDKLPGKIGGKSMADILNGFAAADLRVRADFMKGATFSEVDKYSNRFQSVRLATGCS
jgi:starch-binding outer membrane protein, SusD/RagB family